MLVKTLEISSRVLGDEHIETLHSMSCLAELYKSKEQCNDAEELFTKTLRILRRVVSPKHRNIQSCLNNLALLYVKQGQYEKAESLLLEALKVTNDLSLHHPARKFCVNNLVQLYEAWDKPEQTEQWQAKLQIKSQKVKGN